MKPTLRLLPFGVADGATNMAADEAMLESACDHGVASLRFYRWSEPTVTLGYFQPFASRELPTIAPLSWVRRSTGGAAIVHHHELTYSFALPTGVPWKSSDSWICRMHRLVAAVLAERGVASRLVICGEEQKLGDVLCFLHQTPGDLVTEGSKVAGSAQRKLRGALLQHGSILLRRSGYAPQLAGINDLSVCEPLTPEALAEALTLRFAEDVTAAVLPGDWTVKELDRLPRIRAEKYANAEWNGRR